MSKKRKKKPSADPWVNDIRAVTGRKRVARPYKLPVSYIMAVADTLHKSNASRDIIYNTLKEFYSVAFERGYVRKGEDFTWFRDRQAKHFDEAFKEFQTEVDDIIHKSTNEQSK